MKRAFFIASLFCAWLFQTNVALAQTITVSNATGKVGDIVKVAISLNNNPGLTQMKLHLIYNKNVLAIDRVEDTGLLKGFNMPPQWVPGYDYPSPLTLDWNDGFATTNNTANGVFVNVWFKVVDLVDFKNDVISVTSGGIFNYNLDVVPFTLIPGKFTPVWTWTPQPTSVDPTDWNEADNWTPQEIPSEISDIFIPQSASYPILKSTDNAKANSIHFAPGAELGRQDLLNYTKAFVQLDFSSTGLARNQWWMLTNPLQELFAGDFSFGGLPGMDLKTFIPDGTGQNVWTEMSGPAQKFGPGESFELWLSTANDPAKGLGVTSGIITLPYFDDPIEKDVHWTQVYNSPTSDFYGWTNNGGYERTINPLATVNRDLTRAYKLVEVDNNYVFTQNLKFGLGVIRKYSYATAGNPFMSSIDFNLLCEDNKDITANYWIWEGGAAATGGTYVTYNTDVGPLGVIYATSPERFIPPMQSFIVEVLNTAPSISTLKFDISHISTTAQNTSGLRSTAQSKSNLLEIIASTSQSAVRAVVASREGGSPYFGRKDAHKLFAGINSLPDIYLLKPDADNSMTAIGADILNEIKEDVIIPLGISTTYEGSITLSFEGMDVYNARIFLIDNAAPNKKEIELSGKAKYEYTFNYVPEKVNGTAVSNEKRFAVRLSPTSITGIESATSDNILIYSRSAGTIQAVSSKTIRQITVFNIQGKKLYDNASVNAGVYTVTGLSSDVYIAKVVTENEVKTVKIIVK